MRFTIRRGVAATATAAAFSAGLLGLAAPAAAQPTIYDPELTPCSHLFRTPIDFSQTDLDTYWSPFGTSGIACYDDGTGIERYYQQDPWGNWHVMNELLPGQWFYEIFNTSIPDQAHWAP
ncbi:hypothetical protein [Rhodococcus sp. NPDC058521]|uniref:hypothetical protein n=1 Tax=Rhodococcus sp. NPDC058521 TaxID=3346536 RepID=UPI0036633B6D